MLGASKCEHFKEARWFFESKEVPCVASREAWAIIMYYVYILRSVKFLNQIYTGSTPDLKERLKSHNNGANKHTSKFRPWKVIWYGAFSTRQKAEKFEKYLKTASGIAFQRKRLI
jgi:predicted GIY-YIG superfamily endonuclease